jgi:hypothetical protein
LNESKLLAASKNSIEQKTAKNFTSNDVSTKNLTANKMRPNKKRG